MATKSETELAALMRVDRGVQIQRQAEQRGVDREAGAESIAPVRIERVSRRRLRGDA
jgi:hypothetical protein